MDFLKEARDNKSMLQKIPTHFSELLDAEFKIRRSRNKSYSLRAYARDLEMSPSMLSQLLAKKLGLSKKKSRAVATLLGFTPEKIRFFETLVEASCARSESRRKAAFARLWSFDTEFLKLRKDYFQVIAEWYHFAIMEFVSTKGFQNDPEWIAMKLGIPRQKAKQAMERLLRLDILKNENGKLMPQYDYIVVPSGSPIDAGKRFHEQVMKKAVQALWTDSVEKRNFSSVIFKMRKSDLEKVDAKLKFFRRKLVKELESGEGHDSVHAFSMQFFRLDHE